MSKKIDAYGPAGFTPYTRPANRPALPSPQVRQAEAPAANHTIGGHDDTPSRDSDLSAAEQHMIQRAFPNDPDLAIRLYGPNRDAHTIDPGAVGNQLDVQG